MQRKKDNITNYKGTLDGFRKILLNEGWIGLYSGLSVGLISAAVSQGVYFYCYRFFKTLLEGTDRNKKELSIMKNLLVAAMSGVVTTLTTTPLSVINTRMAIEGKFTKSPNKNHTILSTFLSLYSSEGVLGLWNGLIPGLILVSNPTIQFAVFEKLKEIIQKRRATKSLLPIHVFLLGAIGKTVATIITYPYIVIKSRLQMKNFESNHEPYKGTTDVASKILTHEGIKGFYRGLSSQISRSVLNAAFLFMFQAELVKLIVLFVSSLSY